MDSKFDVVIFGATGCIGKCVVLEAVKVLQGLKWAIAGYSRARLERLLSKVSQRTDTDLRCVPILLANACDSKSIESLVQKCKVLINCCGPHQLWAEGIIVRCIRFGTHYVDMSNCPYFNEMMELRYHQSAVENNVYVISSCGFQSFPLEMGMNYIRQQFDGTVNHVDSFVRYTFSHQSSFPVCPLFSHSMWINTVWSCALAGEMPWLREEMREVELPPFLPKQEKKNIFHKCTHSPPSVYMRCPFIDRTQVERSQYHLYVNEDIIPMQFYQYVEFPSFLWAFIFLIWFLLVALFSLYFYTRNFLFLHPKFFSLGVCSDDERCKCIVDQYSGYRIVLKATGWSEVVETSALSPCSALRLGYFDQHMALEICGANPFYGCGCLCILLAARCILEESDNMPGSGGVYSPGYAFYKTNILTELLKYPNYIGFRSL